MGGSGGSGSYTTSTTQTLGPSYSYQYYPQWQDNEVWFHDDLSYGYLRAIGWGANSGVQYSLGQWSQATSFSAAGYTWTKGAFVTSVNINDSSVALYKVSRTGTVTTTTSTSGGSGGSFGVGAGYNQSATNAVSGSSGGTNAGNGGSGSNGAALGTAASNSSAGGNGNVSNGSAGQSGGAAGAAVTGTSVTMNNSGTLHGAVA